jgi:hypothetical protein
MTNFTPEDLLEYHYDEMPAETRSQLNKELASNWALRQKLLVIEEAAQRLDKSMVSPDNRVVGRILAYAKTNQANVSIAGS